MRSRATPDCVRSGTQEASQASLAPLAKEPWWAWATIPPRWTPNQRAERNPPTGELGPSPRPPGPATTGSGGPAESAAARPALARAVAAKRGEARARPLRTGMIQRVRSAAPCRHGVLAFGDSITNGGGELQWGVALQSWALWTARGLGLPFTTYAVDGATVAEVLREQWPDFRARSADPDARYDVACLYAGVNDVRRSDWDAGRFAERFAEALGLVAGHADRTLICTLPRDLGRPRAGAKVEEANAAIERAARAAGALVVDLRDFGARNHVMVDHVHPTAFGQVAIAERALDVLAADGLAPRVRPHTLLRYETTPWRRLRGDATYAYRHAKGSARAAWVLARARRG